MIISRTPLRVSLAGGGTDIQDYYRTGYGSVLSLAIKNYMYVTVNKRFEDDIRISYSKTEIVDAVDKIYEKALQAGAVSGKLTGAGGGGFLALFVPTEKQQGVRSALSSLKEIDFKIEPQGSKIIYVGDDM